MLRAIAVLTGLSCVAWAQCPTGYTSIVGPLYNPINRGIQSGFTGYFVVTPPRIPLSAAATFGRTPIRVTMTNGALAQPLCLLPNTTSNPPSTSYSVAFQGTGSEHWDEYWVVPASGSDVEIRTIRTSTVPSILAYYLTTKGDLLSYSTAPGRLAKGTDGYVLSADSTQTFGLKWIAPEAASGSMVYPGAGLPISTGFSWGTSLTAGTAGHVVRSNGSAYVDAAIQAGDIPTLNQNTTGTAGGLSAAYIDWSAGSGGTSILNKPTLAANTIATTSNFFSAYNSTTGAFTKAQPACADLSNAGTGCSGAAMAYPGSGIPNSTGSAWGTSYALVTTLANPGTDTNIPSEKAVRDAIGASGGGTVSSVGLAGTANQITVTGATPITSSGSWTLSLPSVLTLPGTINKITLTAPTTAWTIQPTGDNQTTVVPAGTLINNTQNTSGTAANLSGTPALPNGTTATTQSQADNTTKLATTAYVDTGLGGKASSSAATTVNGVSCVLGSTCTVADSTKVPTTTTVNGHALSANVIVTASDVSLGSVTNDAQTKAAIVPNTAPSAGQILVGNAGGTAYAPVSMSQDCTITSAGVITCTKSNNVSLGLFSTATGAVNAQTATYQVLAADFTNLKLVSVASGTFTITLVASGSQPAAGQYITILNYGTGVVTLARSGQNINGAASNLTGTAGSATAPTGWMVWSDGTNYIAEVIGGGSGGTSVNVNGSSVSIPNFQITTPSAEAGYQNAKFQVSSSSVSAEISQTNQLYNTSSSLGTSTGSGLYIPGSSLTAGSVYYQASGGLTAAKADASTTVPAICVAVSTTQCAYVGTYRFGSSQSWTAGQILYVSDASAGAIINSAPSTSAHYVQRIGVALANDTIQIMPSIDVVGIQ